MFLICLVKILQNALLDIEQADGILFTEYQSLVGDKAALHSQPPQKVDASVCRAANIYSIAFGKIRQIFHTVGLSNSINVSISKSCCKQNPNNF